jgi:hypothetical protein
MKRVVWLVSTVLLLAACAINDVPTEPSPVVTATPLPPTATFNFNDGCTITEQLENWLQTSSLLFQSFQDRLDSMVGKDRTQLDEDVLYISSLRDSLNAAPTPDCAADFQSALNKVFTQAIETYQGYINGSVPDISAALDALQTPMNEATQAQEHLLARLQIQMQETPEG